MTLWQQSILPTLAWLLLTLAQSTTSGGECMSFRVDSCYFSSLLLSTLGALVQPVNEANGTLPQPFTSGVASLRGQALGVLR